MGDLAASLRPAHVDAGFRAIFFVQPVAVIAAHPWCSNCGATSDLTADHVTPLARGGHPLGPLRVLCRSCNSSRRADTDRQPRSDRSEEASRDVYIG
jgi:5-methylcytosine-specific restriction endonuclease McrA